MNSKSDKKNVANVIAIDGPAGSGKSTIAKLLATKLDALYIDTGAMFRAIAFYFNQLNVDFEDTKLINEKLSTIDFHYGKSESELVLINNINYTSMIRSSFVSTLASLISKNSDVRNFLLSIQRNLVKQRLCVMEGRDIGTVVFPNAVLKIFLSADVKIRAKRRFEQLRSSGIQSETYESTLESLLNRDEEDTNRKVAPLVASKDSLIIDSTNLSTQEVVHVIIDNYLKTK